MTEEYIRLLAKSPLRQHGTVKELPVVEVEHDLQTDEESLDDAGGDEKVGSEKGQAARLLTMVERAIDGGVIELFHDDSGKTYLSAKTETFEIESKDCRELLAGMLYDQDGDGLTATAAKTVEVTLCARARFAGRLETVHVRVGEHDGKVYLDLANAERQVVEIDANDWRVTTNSPIRFLRPAAMKALPVPVRKGGALEALWRFVRAGDDDKLKVLAWLVGALNPSGPYWALWFGGVQGAAKSSAQEFCRSLVDPNTAPLRSLPKNTRDLMVSASKSHVQSFNNLSSIKPEMSDALCCLSTGAGFGTRALYSDNDEQVFSLSKPVMMNGIGDVVTAPDLLDRTLRVDLPAVEDARRRSMKDLYAEYEVARPGMLGCLLDAVAAALANLGAVRKKERTWGRMADAEQWATAAEEVLKKLGGIAGDQSLAKVLEDATGETHDDVLETDSIAAFVIELVNAQENDTWSGTATELLAELTRLAGSKSRLKAWPATATMLSTQLNRIAPALKHRGVIVGRSEKRTNGRRVRTLTRIPIDDEWG